jgi:uncharacterized protein
MENKPKIAITGASGFVGKAIGKQLKLQGYAVLPISRTLLYEEPSVVAKALAGCGIIINLAGAPILQRWTAAAMHAIYDSRILTTQTLSSAIALLETPPALFISASAVGIYNSIDNHDEYSQLLADDFLGAICKDWEKAATTVTSNRSVRLAILRFGVVLGKQGGAYPKMSLPFRFGVGGKIGHGSQWFPFVHIADVVKAVEFIIDNKNTQGIYNLVAPENVTNQQFTKALGKQLCRPHFMPVPTKVLSLLYGEAATVLTSGQYVIPNRLLHDGFTFNFPTLSQTLSDLEKR